MKSTCPITSANLANRTTFHKLVLGLVLGWLGFTFGPQWFTLRLGWFATGPHFRYQHVGISNAEVSGWGYCPTQSPKARGGGGP